MSNKTSLVRAGFCAVFVVAASAACSTNVGSGEEVAQSEDELRALGSDEIVGTLTYGQTSAPVEYTEEPTYRAFKFSGTAGDQIEIDAKAQFADARVWLLAPNFRTLKSNDDASTTTRDARITHRLTQTGTHYIAFREKNFEEATFTITLKKSGATPPPPPPPPPPPTSTTEFDYAAACPGSTITYQQLLSKFAPASTTATLGRIVMDGRKRACHDQTGCGPWQAAGEVPFYKVVWSSSRYSFSHDRNIAVPAAGTAKLTATTSSVELALSIDSVPGLAVSDQVANGSVDFRLNPLKIDNTHVQVGGWSSGSGSYLWFHEDKITNNCFFAQSSGRVYGQTSGSYTEYHVVFYGTY